MCQNLVGLAHHQIVYVNVIKMLHGVREEGAIYDCVVIEQAWLIIQLFM
jgi:hypothetical protein